MEEKQKPVGGIAFFCSLLFLALLAAQNTRAILPLMSVHAVLMLAAFFAAALVGTIMTWRLLPNTICVFIHEFKHALLSGLAGNKLKGLVVQRDSGHVEYSYTRDTAAYNAFISLAPYITPLLTFPAVTAMVIIEPAHHTVAVLLAGLAWGADFYLNTRDISPVQTDLSGLRGGYTIGKLYILFCNAAFFTFVAAWVIGGRSGLVQLVVHLWNIARRTAGIA